MSKEDEIRKLREAKYDREHQRANGRSGASPPQPEKIAASDRDKPLAQAKRNSNAANRDRRESLEESADQKPSNSSFDRLKYQREYMVRYREKKVLERKALDAELKRLRELVEK